MPELLGEGAAPGGCGAGGGLPCVWSVPPHKGSLVSGWGCVWALPGMNWLCRAAHQGLGGLSKSDQTRPPRADRDERRLDCSRTLRAGVHS